jgi:hypothetical protein
MKGRSIGESRGGGSAGVDKGFATRNLGQLHTKFLWVSVQYDSSPSTLFGRQNGSK